jgi:hypothetical protein
VPAWSDAILNFNDKTLEATKKINNGLSSATDVSTTLCKTRVGTSSFNTPKTWFQAPRILKLWPRLKPPWLAILGFFIYFCIYLFTF